MEAAFGATIQGFYFNYIFTWKENYNYFTMRIDLHWIFE